MKAVPGTVCLQRQEQREARWDLLLGRVSYKTSPTFLQASGSVRSPVSETTRDGSAVPSADSSSIEPKFGSQPPIQAPDNVLLSADPEGSDLWPLGIATHATAIDL